MTMHARCFHSHRLLTCPFAHLLLEGRTDSVPDQVINLRTDVLRSIVRSRLLKFELEVLMTWAAALEFAQ